MASISIDGVVEIYILIGNNRNGHMNGINPCLKSSFPIQSRESQNEIHTYMIKNLTTHVSWGIQTLS